MDKREGVKISENFKDIIIGSPVTLFLKTTFAPSPFIRDSSAATAKEEIGGKIWADSQQEFRAPKVF